MRRTLELQRTLELEIEALREQRELLKLLKYEAASSQNSQKAAEKEEKNRDRLIQSALEYWKAQYDFQKHVMTGGLTAAAVFITLLGGFFKGPEPWSIGDQLADILIVLIIVFLFGAVLPSTMAARYARRMLWSVQNIDTDADNAYKTVDDPISKRFKRWNIVSLIMLACGFILLLIFVASVLYTGQSSSNNQPQGEVTVKLYVSPDGANKLSVQQVPP